MTYITLLSLSKLNNTILQLLLNFGDVLFILSLTLAPARWEMPVPLTTHLEFFSRASNANPASLFIDILSMWPLSTLSAVLCTFRTLDLDIYATNFTVRHDHANMLTNHLHSQIPALSTLPKVLAHPAIGFGPSLSAPMLSNLMIRNFFACHHAYFLNSVCIY